MSFTIPLMYLNTYNIVSKRIEAGWDVKRAVLAPQDCNLPLSLCEVQCPETGWGDSLRGVGLEDRARSTSLHYKEIRVRLGMTRM